MDGQGREKRSLIVNLNICYETFQFRCEKSFRKTFKLSFAPNSVDPLHQNVCIRLRKCVLPLSNRTDHDRVFAYIFCQIFLCVNDIDKTHGHYNGCVLKVLSADLHLSRKCQKCIQHKRMLQM